MKSTRDRILQTLLRQPRTTINELAVAVGIDPISVRHHLTNLQVEGLVATDEERHGVGRPRLVYFLTEDGMERFPTRYLRLTTRLLAQMKESMPAPVVSKLFAEMADGLAKEYTDQMKGMNMEERLDLAKSLLTEEGFTIEWEKSGSQYQIHEITCPYLQIGQSHPEVCTVDQTLISRMLAVPAEKIKCVLQGDAHCTYVVQAEGRDKMSAETKVTPIHWELQDTHPDLVEPLRAKLSEVVDPEIALNVIQLGLIRKVRIEDKEAKLYVLLTTPFCPYGPAMLDVIKQKAEEALNMPVTLELGMETWDFSLMEDPGALDWGMYT